MAKAKVAVKVSVEVPTWVGSKTVEVELTASEARAARNPEVLQALAALKVPSVSRFANIKALDRAVKSAYRKSSVVRRLLHEKALEKVNGDTEVAEAYIRAWLRAENRELPSDDPDAQLVTQQYYSLVWKFGDRYVVQVAPWE
jgi:hypothetical protein